MMNTIQRTTRKSGHSIITTLPPDVLKSLEIEVGDKIEYVLKGDKVEIRKAPQKDSNDFLATVQAVMQDYDTTLESLVER